MAHRIDNEVAAGRTVMRTTARGSTGASAFVESDCTPDAPLLTVIIPVYNEAETIAEVIRRVQSAPYHKQILVVDDGSTDETPHRLCAVAAPSGIEVLLHETNRGKGAAIRTGLAHAVGRFVIIQDGDLEYDPNDYPRLVEPLRNGSADAVFGSRFLDPSSDSHRGRRLFNCGVKMLNVAVRVLYRVRLTDEATCYKAFPTETLRQMDLQCSGFEFCPEVTAKAARLGLRIQEVTISYHPRTSTEGKKIRLRDGYEAARTLWKWRKWKAPAPLRRLIDKSARSS